MTQKPRQEEPAAFLDEGIYLRSVRVNRGQLTAAQQQDYPFSIPAIARLEQLDFPQPVTFFIGENGAGKSTLLEGLAVACGLNPEGGSRHMTFSTYDTHSPLSRYLSLVRNPRRPRDSYFLRAESLYNLATQLDELDEIPAAAPPLLKGYGGRSLHRQSHGESFFSLLHNRFGGRGLYLLDEPEAALSPTRQMAMLSLMEELVEQNSQLIIATHSPILLAYPRAQIYCFTQEGILPQRYEETENYQLTRRFLNDYRGMLQRLLSPSPQEPTKGGITE